MSVNAAAGLDSLVAAVRAEKFRFLAAERYRAYAAILWILAGHRRAHEVEVYYDDLMMEALEIVPEVEPGPYTPDTFRSDLKQLVDWGNLAPLRLEPRRIETLSDRNLQKFLCRIDDETVAIMEFLAGRARAGTAALTDRGRHLLRDAAERLKEAQLLARRILRGWKKGGNGNDGGSRDRDDEDLQRLWYLCIEADGKVDDAAQELAAFHAALVGFAVNPFRLEALAEVVDRLERYVEDYIAEATGRARTMHRTAKKLAQPPLAAVLARSHELIERRLRDDPLLAGSAPPGRDVLELVGKLGPFFSPGGRFEALLERIHGSARDVVRRVHKHVENVRARNIRMETLRDRSREMAALDDGRTRDLAEANAWINRLFASAHLMSDARCGTPVARAAPPRPAKRYEARRAVQRGECLVEKRGRPGQSRALERLRLLRLGRFVEQKILRGAGRAQLEGAALDGFDDFRILLDAIKAHEVRAGRFRARLSYRILRPGGNGKAGPRARFSGEGGELDAPDLTFSRAAGGGDHE